MGAAFLEQALAARAEIADIVFLSCHAFDRRRWTLFDRIFHADALCGTGNSWMGWRDHVVRERQDAAAVITSHHQLGATLIALEGDDATAESYISTYFRVRANAAATNRFTLRDEEYCVFGGGRYVDTFQHRDGEWRIARRLITAEWAEEQSIRDAGLSTVAPHFRGLDGDDDATLPLVSGWL